MALADSSARRLARFTFRQVHKILARGFRPAELRQNAMVFSPHPDDETLGCGGTVILKRSLGAVVEVVFMTDGAGSHPGLISAEDLGRERQREAMAATASLGVDTQHVTWFGFPDGGLAQHHGQAVAQVTELLRQKRPPQIFVPFSKHEHPDHIETHEVVHEAVTKAGLTTLLCEYPIWYLNQWPFVRSEEPDPKKMLLSGPRAWLGAGHLAPFNIRVNLAAVAERKRRALAEHKSQVARRGGDPHWRILGDLSDGDFLNSFFEAEVFRCVRVR